MSSIEEMEAYVATTPAAQIRVRYDSTETTELGDLITAIQTHIAIGRLPELEAMFPEFAHCNPDNFESNPPSYHHSKETREAFKSICKKHLESEVPDADFEDHRNIARNGQWVFCGDKEELQQLASANRETIIDVALTESGLDLTDLTKPFRGETIDTLNGAPVLFFKEQGIYAYQETAGSGFILEAWLTFPAYPNGW